MKQILPVCLLFFTDVLLSLLLMLFYKNLTKYSLWTDGSVAAIWRFNTHTHTHTHTHICLSHPLMTQHTLSFSPQTPPWPGNTSSLYKLEVIFIVSVKYHLLVVCQ